MYKPRYKADSKKRVSVRRRGRNDLGRYRSRFEKSLAPTLRSSFVYEPKAYKYTLTFETTYTPDWESADGKLWLEAKGRFRTHAEARKYLSIRDCYPNKTLVFIFQQADTPMPGARKRKDGTRFSVSEWATKHGFEWYTPRSLPSRLRKQTRNKD